MSLAQQLSKLNLSAQNSINRGPSATNSNSPARSIQETLKTYVSSEDAVIDVKDDDNVNNYYPSNESSIVFPMPPNNTLKSTRSPSPPLSLLSAPLSSSAPSSLLLSPILPESTRSPSSPILPESTRSPSSPILPESTRSPSSPILPESTRSPLFKSSELTDDASLDDNRINSIAGSLMAALKSRERQMISSPGSETSGYSLTPYSLQFESELSDDSLEGKQIQIPIYSKSKSPSIKSASSPIAPVSPRQSPVRTPSPRQSPARTPSPKPVSPRQTPVRTPSPKPVSPIKIPVRTPSPKPVSPKPVSPIKTPVRTPSPKPVSPRKTPVRTPSPKPVSPKPVSPRQSPVRTPSPKPVSPRQTPVRTPSPKPVSPRKTPVNLSSVRTPSPKPVSPRKTPVNLSSAPPTSKNMSSSCSIDKGKNPEIINDEKSMCTSITHCSMKVDNGKMEDELVDKLEKMGYTIMNKIVTNKNGGKAYYIKVKSDQGYVFYIQLDVDMKTIMDENTTPLKKSKSTKVDLSSQMGAYNCSRNGGVCGVALECNGELCTLTRTDNSNKPKQLIFKSPKASNDKGSSVPYAVVRMSEIDHDKSRVDEAVANSTLNLRTALYEECALKLGDLQKSGVNLSLIINKLIKNKSFVMEELLNEISSTKNDEERFNKEKSLLDVLKLLINVSEYSNAIEEIIARLDYANSKLSTI